MGFRNYSLVLFTILIISVSSGPRYASAEVLCANKQSGVVSMRPEGCEPDERVVDLSGVAQAPRLKPSRWRWLGEGEGTYWYVPNANLPAVEWDSSDPQNYSPILDQTVWHIENYEGGYFFGTVVAQIGVHPPQCQYLIGSVTPNGTVYMTFNSLASVPVGSPSLTTGTGKMVLKENIGLLLEQCRMASGTSSKFCSVAQRGVFARECTPNRGVLDKTCPEYSKACLNSFPIVLLNRAYPDFLRTAKSCRKSPIHQAPASHVTAGGTPPPGLVSCNGMYCHSGLTASIG